MWLISEYWCPCTCSEWLSLRKHLSVARCWIYAEWLSFFVSWYKKVVHAGLFTQHATDYYFEFGCTIMGFVLLILSLLTLSSSSSPLSRANRTCLTECFSQAQHRSKCTMPAPRRLLKVSSHFCLISMFTLQTSYLEACTWLIKETAAQPLVNLNLNTQNLVCVVL